MKLIYSGALIQNTYIHTISDIATYIQCTHTKILTTSQINKQISTITKQQKQLKLRYEFLNDDKVAASETLNGKLFHKTAP